MLMLNATIIELYWLNLGTKRIHTPKIRYEKTVEIKLIEKTSEANHDIFSSLSRYLAPSLIA